MPFITWYKDDIVVDEAQIIAGGTILQLPKIGPLDEGIYRCHAENIVGTDDHEWSLIVHTPPVINHTSNQKATVLKSEEYTIECGAAGKPTPLISWTRNGRPLIDDRIELDSDSGFSRAVVSDVILEDRGAWTCVASNAAGSVSIDFELDVWQAPESSSQTGPVNNGTSQPIKNHTAIISSNFNMHCDVDAYPPPDITWFHNGRIVNFDRFNHHYVLSKSKEILTINGATADDSGEWRCVAKNLAGSMTAKYHVDIWQPPHIPTETTQKVIPVLIHQGRTLRLECPAEGNPRPTLQWTRGGIPIEYLDEQRYNVKGNGTLLEIAGAGMLDATRFKCTATNEAGISDISYSIEVQVPPTIKSQNFDRDVVQGETVVIRCSASGLPEPIVAWFFNGAPVTAGGNVSILRGGSVLSISSVDTTDSGQYTCRAINSAGSDSFNYDLDISVPPEIRDGKSTETSFIDGVVDKGLQLQCQVKTGYPTPAIRWEKDGQQLLGAANYRFLHRGQLLRIMQISDDSAGRYTCTVRNQAGSDYRSYVVSVHHPPAVDHSAEQGQSLIL